MNRPRGVNIIFDKYGISQNANALGSNNCLPFFWLFTLFAVCLFNTDPLLASIQGKGFEPNHWLIDNLKAPLDYSNPDRLFQPIKICKQCHMNFAGSSSPMFTLA